MAKTATATVAEQQADFVASVYTKSVCDKIEKLGEFIGSRTLYVKMIGDEIHANGGRYAHHKPGKDASGIDKGQASDMRRTFGAHLEKKLEAGFTKEWANYKMDKATFSAITDPEIKAKAEKDRVRVGNAISDSWRDLCNHLAFLEGIEVGRKSKSASKPKAEAEDSESEGEVSGEIETQKIVEALMVARKRLQSAEHVTFDIVSKVASLDAILVSILGKMPEGIDEE